MPATPAELPAGVSRRWACTTAADGQAHGVDLIKAGDITARQPGPCRKCWSSHRVVRPRRGQLSSSARSAAVHCERSIAALRSTGRPNISPPQELSLAAGANRLRGCCPPGAARVVHGSITETTSCQHRVYNRNQLEPRSLAQADARVESSLVRSIAPSDLRASAELRARRLVRTTSRRIRRCWSRYCDAREGAAQQTDPPFRPYARSLFFDIPELWIPR
jgi:hypothetical protein